MVCRVSNHRVCLLRNSKFSSLNPEQLFAHQQLSGHQVQLNAPYVFKLRLISKLKFKQVVVINDSNEWRDTSILQIQLNVVYFW